MKRSTITNPKRLNRYGKRKYDYLAVFDYIVNFKLANDGLNPSIREIGAAFGINSTSNVHHILSALIISEKLYVNDNGLLCVTGGQWNMPEPKTVVVRAAV